jgi:4-hydroxyphenylacetate 3-monooxygenase
MLLDAVPLGDREDLAMLKTGQEYLEGLRDGRVIYIGGERVDDVTKHPAFRNAAHTYARIYDARFDPSMRDALTVDENNERYAAYYLKPRTRADLERRSRCSEVIADLTYGMMGRSPDFIGGYITGAAMQSEVFDNSHHKFSEHVIAYWEHARRNDLFVSHAVTPVPGSRDYRYAGGRETRQPALAAIDEDDSGVYISGMKMLATSAAFSDEVWIGNIQPLAEGHENEAITCCIPCNAPGLSLWSRKPFERYAVSELDNPLAYRYDESDCIVVCNRVHVPWERVFVHQDSQLSREIYFRTPAHTLSNHQSGVRYRAKIRLLIALARRITQMSGTDKIPAVQDEIGHLAAIYGQVSAMIDGQIHALEEVGHGYVNYNRHYMYSMIYFATQQYDHICSKVRELLGGGVLQMPADVSVMQNPETRQVFEELWHMSSVSAQDRYKVMKLAWDILGTDFAGRHMQYERFYMGPAFVVRIHNNRECPWEKFDLMLDGLLSSYGAGDVFNRGVEPGPDAATCSTPGDSRKA